MKMTSSIVNQSSDDDDDGLSRNSDAQVSDCSEGSEDSDELVAAYRARIAKAHCCICVLILLYICVRIVC
jgi:hypothetical protein